MTEETKGEGSPEERWAERHRRWRKRPRWLRAPMFLALAAAIAGLVGLVVMGLWNWLAPALFAAPEIGWLQGLGLFVLARLLFGGWGPGRHHHGGAHWRSRWQHKTEGLSPEERERMARMLRGRFGHESAAGQ